VGPATQTQATPALHDGPFAAKGWIYALKQKQAKFNSLTSEKPMD
jgi:hypothetical protein